MQQSFLVSTRYPTWEAYSLAVLLSRDPEYSIRRKIHWSKKKEWEKKRVSHCEHLLVVGYIYIPYMGVHIKKSNPKTIVRLSTLQKLVKNLSWATCIAPFKTTFCNLFRENLKITTDWTSFKHIVRSTHCCYKFLRPDLDPVCKT